MTNDYWQPVGEPVPDWAPVPFPEALTLPGLYCTLERLDPGRHTDDLYAAYAAASETHDWTYLPFGPFPRQGPTATGRSPPRRAMIPGTTPSSTAPPVVHLAPSR